MDIAEACVEDRSERCSVFGYNFTLYYRAMDIAEACVEDRSERCSVFGKWTVMEQQSVVKELTMMTRNMTCEDNLGLCLHRFLYSTMSVIHADTVLANVTKSRDMVASQVRRLFIKR